jgi:hypothetical protein
MNPTGQSLPHESATAHRSLRGLTYGSVCPTWLRKRLRRRGTGAFACQPILPQPLTGRPLGPALFRATAVRECPWAGCPQNVIKTPPTRWGGPPGPRPTLSSATGKALYTDDLLAPQAHAALLSFDPAGALPTREAPAV